MGTLALLFLIFVAAAFAQSVTGFGFALAAVPLLALLASPRTAVVAAALVSLVLTGGTTLAEREHVRWRPAGWLLLAAAVGMPAGLLALRALPSAALLATIAVVTLGCTAIVWRRWQMPASRAAVGTVGVVCGVLTTATGTNGPPLVAALQSMGYPPRRLRATLAAIFTGAGMVAIVGFALSGALTPRTVGIAAIGLPAVALGGWAGNRLFHRIDHGRFRTLVLAALVCSSLVALVHAVASIR